MRIRISRLAGALGLCAAIAMPCLPASSASGAPQASPPFVGPTAGWLATVNYYRAMANEAPLVDNSQWQTGTTAHSCYMLLNGIAHAETVGKPGYTSAGDQAGQNGNVTVSSDINATERTFIELWMAAPFHAIGILRPALQSTNFGVCRNPATDKWHSAATLDVLRGNPNPFAVPATPILFPGDGTTTNLNVMSAETPDPRAFCGWGGEVGLPIIAMMPEGFSGTPTGSLSTAAGPVDACILSGNNTTGTAQAILAGSNAVLIVPRVKLAAGTYSAAVTTSARTVTWSFTVDPAAATAPAGSDVPSGGGTGETGGGSDGGASEPSGTAALSSDSTLHSLRPNRIVDSRVGQNASRVAAYSTQHIRVTGLGGVPAGADAVSGNFTVTGSNDGGYLTVWNCSDPKPVVSTLNFRPGETVPNGASVPLNDSGELCVTASTAVDLLIDVNGYYANTEGGGRFASVAPARLMDTRIGVGGSGRLVAGTVTPLAVAGTSGVPSSASMAVLNVTSISPDADGYVTVFPCDGPVPEVSSLNPSPGAARPNIVITPLASNGSVCLFTVTDVDIVVDITGYVSGNGSNTFTTATPFRLSDTRAARTELNAGTSGGLHKGDTMVIKVAGQRGIAGDAKAISANITAVGGDVPGYLTVWPCGPQPNTSTVNFASGTAVANGAQVPLSADGSVCVYANTNVQVIVDVNGWWS